MSGANTNSKSTLCALLVLATATVCTAQTQNDVAKFNASGNTVNSSIYDNGNVGIGTTVPNSRLEVDGTGQGTVDLLLQDSGTGSHFFFLPNASWGYANPLVQPGDQVLGFTGNGIDSGNLDIVPWSASSKGIRITSAGNVGVGTTNPAAKLDVVGVDGGIRIYDNGGGGQQILKFQAASGSNPYSWNIWGDPSGGGLGNGNLFVGQTVTNPTTSATMTFARTGNVGIGTTAPSTALEVNGSVKLSPGSGGGIVFPDATTQTTAWTGVLCGGDYAESVDASGQRAQYEPGDVLVVDPDNDENVLKSAQPYSTSVVGVYSTKPGVIGRRSADPSRLAQQIPMAMVGIVPTKVSIENGPIKPGDLLVTSSIAGYAMKGTDRNRLTGAVIGKAFGRLASGAGVIDVLVSLQ